MRKRGGIFKFTNFSSVTQTKLVQHSKFKFRPEHQIAWKLMTKNHLLTFECARVVQTSKYLSSLLHLALNVTLLE